jgi:hypothetical protein
MTQRLRSNGVQVVGGSNPPCPTNSDPNRPKNFGDPPISRKS